MAIATSVTYIVLRPFPSAPSNAVGKEFKERLGVTSKKLRTRDVTGGGRRATSAILKEISATCKDYCTKQIRRDRN